MARGFGAQATPVLSKSPPNVIPAPNGAGVISGCQWVTGANISNWLSLKPQSTGSFGPLMEGTVRNVESGAPVSGGQAMIVVPTAQGVATPPSGEPDQFYLAPGFGSVIGGGGIQSQPRNVFSDTAPWTLVSSSSLTPFFELYPPGIAPPNPAQVWGAVLNLGSNTNLNPDSGSINSFIEAVDVFGNVWTHSEQLASYGYFSAGWVAVPEVNYTPTLQLVKGSGVSGYGPVTVASIRVGLAAQAVNPTTLAIDSPVFGPYVNAPDAVVVLPGVVQTATKVFTVPEATFAFQYPAAPSSGQVYRQDLIFVDPDTEQYVYQQGIVTTVEVNQPPGSGVTDAVPILTVNLTTTSAGAHGSSTGDLRNILGDGYAT